VGHKESGLRDDIVHNGIHGGIKDIVTVSPVPGAGKRLRRFSFS
jgi:hypothetical protein